jgi:hypothetical protein
MMVIKHTIAKAVHYSLRRLSLCPRFRAFTTTQSLRTQGKSQYSELFEYTSGW